MRLNIAFACRRTTALANVAVTFALTFSPVILTPAGKAQNTEISGSTKGTKKMNTNEQAIASALAQYEKALNESATAKVAELYAPDGVFMPQHSPSSVGIEAVRRAYDKVFENIALSIKFDVIEIHEIAPGWAFARTNSAGTVRVRATGQSGPEANQELFVFQKLDNAWKIARYCFSTTNPPRS